MKCNWSCQSHFNFFKVAILFLKFGKIQNDNLTHYFRHLLATQFLCQCQFEGNNFCIYHCFQNKLKSQMENDNFHANDEGWNAFRFQMRIFQMDHGTENTNWCHFLLAEQKHCTCNFFVQNHSCSINSTLKAGYHIFNSKSLLLRKIRWCSGQVV